MDDLRDGGANPMMQPFVPASDPRAFRDALGCFATGVTVITAGGPEGPIGITANSFASVSLDPPLVLWSPARASRRFARFHDAQHFAIHVLGEGQRGVCEGFSRSGTAFEDLDWAADAHGVPVIAGCLARFDCARHAVHEAGDHAIILGRVLCAERRDGAPLVFHRGAFGALARQDGV